MNFKIALDAGLSQSELANVLGVTRTTVNLWLNGKMKPHRYNEDHVRQRMDLLIEAIRSKMIPPKSTRRKPRHEAIATAIRQLEGASKDLPV